MTTQNPIPLSENDLKLELLKVYQEEERVRDLTLKLARSKQQIQALLKQFADGSLTNGSGASAAAP